MADKRLRLTVLTPNRTVFDQNVDFVILRTAQGDMGILPGHEACSVLLGYGLLRAFEGKKQTDVLAVLEGFATVEDNRVVVLSTVAERPDKLEATMTKMEKERAENKLHEQAADLEVHRAEMALRRSLVHMDISSYSITKGHDEKTK